MGILNWTRRRRARKTIERALRDEPDLLKQSTYRGQLVRLSLGKDLDELEREGGWDILAQSKFWGQSGDVWDSYTQTQFEELMGASSIIFACVSLICDLAPEAEMLVAEGKGDKRKTTDDHFVLDKLHRPNGYQEYRQFVREIVAHLLLTGETNVWKTRLKGGQIDDLIPTPTSWIEEKWKDGKFLGHVITQPGASKEILVKPGDMMMFKYSDPSDPNTALGPAQAALKDLQIDDARARYMIEMLTNMAVPGTIVSMQDQPDEEQLKEIRRRVMGKIGDGRRGSLAIMSGDAKLVQGAVPPDIDWPGTAGMSEARVCATFKMPPIVVGLRIGLEHATLSNYETAKRALYQNAMKPLWNDLASFFERGLLLSEGEEDMEMEANLDEISELQEDVDSLHTRVLADFHGGLISRNEARIELGLDDLGKVGKVFVQPMNLVEVIVDGELVAEPTRPTGADEDHQQDFEDGEDEDVDEEAGAGDEDETVGEEGGDEE